MPAMGRAVRVHDPVVHTEQVARVQAQGIDVEEDHGSPDTIGRDQRLELVVDDPDVHIGRRVVVQMQEEQLLAGVREAHDR